MIFVVFYLYQPVKKTFMKINRKLIAAFAMLSVVFGACTSPAPDVDCGVKSDLAAPANVVWEESASTKTSLALTWDASAAIAAGATSFSAQVVKPNMETMEEGELHDFIVPDQYDANTTVLIPVTSNYLGSANANAEETPCDQVEFKNLANGKQYMLRVRANYPMSNYSEWVWVTDEAGELAHIKVGKGIVDPTELDDKMPPVVKISYVSAADAIVTWSCADWKNHNADFACAWKIILKKGNDLVVSWNIPANSEIWSSYARNGCAFFLTSLEPETEYNVTVQNVTEGTEPLEATKFTTEASKVVTMPTAPANAGDVILYEDFSELFITSDLSRGAANYSFGQRSSMDSKEWIAKGEDPVANDVEGRGCYLVDPSTEVGLFNTLKNYVGATRLDAWGMMSEDNTAGAICARASQVKMGASSKCAWLVAPEITCLQQTATIEVSFDAALYETDPGQGIVEVLTGCTQAENASNSWVTPADRMTAATFSVAAGWARYTVTIDNINNGARIAIGGNRNGVSGQHRFYLDNIEIKVVSYGDLKLSAPKNVVVTPTDSTAEVVWDKVNSAEQYIVEYTNTCDACGQPVWTALPATAELKAVIEGLTFETEYSVRVKAVAGDVQSEFCEPVAFKTLAEIKKLKAPKDVTTAVGVATVDLTFPAVTKATEYEVYNGETKLSSIFTEAEKVVSLTVYGLEAKTAYNLQLKAVAPGSDMEASDLSEAIAVTTGEISAYVSAGCEYKPTHLTAQWPDWRADHAYTIQLADASGVLGSWTVSFGTSSCVDGKGAQVPTRFTMGGLTPETEYTVSIKAKGAEDVVYASQVLKTTAARAAGAKDVYWQGFDDCFFGGDSHNLAYAVISASADALKLIDWPMTTADLYANIVSMTSTDGPGSANRTAAIQTYCKADPECSLYNWTLAGSEVHSGYLKVGAGGTIGVLTTDVLGEKANGACDISFKVSPRSDGSVCAALVKLVIVHADGTETVAASGLDVLTNGDAFNYTWKTLEVKGVQLQPTDKLRIAGDTDAASGAFRFHVDDILVVAQ